MRPGRNLPTTKTYSWTNHDSSSQTICQEPPHPLLLQGFPSQTNARKNLAESEFLT